MTDIVDVVESYDRPSLPVPIPASTWLVVGLAWFLWYKTLRWVYSVAFMITGTLLMVSYHNDREHLAVSVGFMLLQIGWLTGWFVGKAPTKRGGGGTVSRAGGSRILSNISESRAPTTMTLRSGRTIRSSAV